MSPLAKECVRHAMGGEKTRHCAGRSTPLAVQRDADSGAVFARNPYNTDFAGRTAFFDVDGATGAGSSAGGDRGAFLGRQGSLRHPAAMSQPQLCGRVGVALDPCAALRVGCVLAPGQTHEIVFRLGCGVTPEEARSLVRRWRGPAAAHAALADVQAYWTHTLGAVQVHTPNPALDLLANGWLLYQVDGLPPPLNALPHPRRANAPAPWRARNHPGWHAAVRPGNPFGGRWP